MNTAAIYPLEQYRDFAKETQYICNLTNLARTVVGMRCPVTNRLRRAVNVATEHLTALNDFWIEAVSIEHPSELAAFVFFVDGLPFATTTEPTPACVAEDIPRRVRAIATNPGDAASFSKSEIVAISELFLGVHSWLREPGRIIANRVHRENRVDALTIMATCLAAFRRVAEAAMAEMEPIHQGVAPTSSLAIEN
ncbi:hypothetical protein [Desulfobulbus sp.]|uniref:hypothetical protein n=1 Tax=Desulfobulbus sp. TaxID=895 RepID=UPI0027BA809E|nr:hypothetical protein [Desulfobulbus sp.]